MSIFGIIGFSILIAVLSFSIGMLIILSIDSMDKKSVILNAVIAIVILIASVFIGVGINTNDERYYVSMYKAQKDTIEASVNSDILSDFEKIQIVNKVVDLNGEFAQRKAKYNTWHYVYYDNHIYDDVDFIEFDKDGTEK